MILNTICAYRFRAVPGQIVEPKVADVKFHAKGFNAGTDDSPQNSNHVTRIVPEVEDFQASGRIWGPKMIFGSVTSYRIPQRFAGGTALKMDQTNRATLSSCVLRCHCRIEGLDIRNLVT